MTDHTELRRLALAAKEYAEFWWGQKELSTDIKINPIDADFIATASPEVVLALLDENQKLLEALKEWERVDVIGRDPNTHRESWRELVQERNRKHTAAIAAAERNAP